MTDVSMHTLPNKKNWIIQDVLEERRYLQSVCRSTEKLVLWINLTSQCAYLLSFTRKDDTLVIFIPSLTWLKYK